MAVAEPIAASGPSWDPIVRITHWSVATAIVINGLIDEGGSTLHIWIGYGALAMLVLRLLWGFIGPAEARFSSFPFSLSAAIDHLTNVFSGHHKTHRSHNPAGSVMVYALWGMLTLTAATGMILETEPFPVEHRQHAMAQVDSHEDGEENELEEIVEETHEIAANLLLILAALHVAGVAVESRLSGRNLVRGMIRGQPTSRSRE